MSGPCLCGDPACPVCGTAQGTYFECFRCFKTDDGEGEWRDDGYLCADCRDREQDAAEHLKDALRETT